MFKKVVLLGPTRGGKTKLFERILHSRYEEERYTPTTAPVGGAYEEISGTPMQIWDTCPLPASQSPLKFILNAVLTNPDAVIWVFDADMPDLIVEIAHALTHMPNAQQIPFYLILTQKEGPDDRAVNIDEPLNMLPTLFAAQTSYGASLVEKFKGIFQSSSRNGFLTEVKQQDEKFVCEPCATYADFMARVATQMHPPVAESASDVTKDDLLQYIRDEADRLDPYWRWTIPTFGMIKITGGYRKALMLRAIADKLEADDSADFNAETWINTKCDFSRRGSVLFFRNHDEHLSLADIIDMQRCPGVTKETQARRDLNQLMQA